MVGDSDEPWDLYGLVHKGARLALFRAVTAAGSADGLDDDQVADVVGVLRDTLFVLRAHHQQEDEFVDPLISKHAPELEPVVTEAHLAIDEAIEGIELLAFSLHVTPAAERWEVLYELHLDLAALTGTYLEHLDFEEREVTPALNAAMSRADLMAVTEAIRASVAPRDMCVFLQFMLPAMNADERAALLASMHATEPAEVWELFHGTARDALTAADYETVATRIGLT